MFKEIVLKIDILSPQDLLACETDQVGFNVWRVVHDLGEQLLNLAEQDNVYSWPDGALVSAATALLSLENARKAWRAGRYDEALVHTKAAEWVASTLPAPGR